MRGLTLLLALPACTGIKPVNTPVDADDTASVSVGDVLASPSTLDFGEVGVGSEGTADVTLSNAGTEAATITDAFVTGDSAFSLVTAVSMPMDLEGGGDTVLTFAFAPEAATTYQGTFRIGVSGESGYGEVPLVGTGTDGGSDTDTGEDTGGQEGFAMSVSESALSFGLVDIINPVSETIVLENIGSEDILLTDFGVDEPTFTAEGDSYSLPAVLAVGQSRNLIVTFSPIEEITYSGAITISTDPEAVEAHVALSGVGYRSCTLCSPILEVDTGGTDTHAMSFLDAFVAGPTYSQPLAMSNAGDEPLTIERITVSNDVIAACGDFSTDWGGTATTLEEGEVLRVNVIYTATESCFELPVTELDTNMLHILSDDPSESDWAIGLSATIL